MAYEDRGVGVLGPPWGIVGRGWTLILETIVGMVWCVGWRDYSLEHRGEWNVRSMEPGSWNENTMGTLWLCGQAGPGTVTNDRTGSAWQT